MDKLRYMSVKVQGHSLTLAKGHLVFKLKTLFYSKTVGLLETKYHVKVCRSTGMKIYANGIHHMAKMVAMPIFGKNPSKICKTIGQIAMKLCM